MGKIDPYTLSNGTTKYRARPTGTDPATGKKWSNRSFDTWAAADRYQRHPAGGGDAEPPTGIATLTAGHGSGTVAVAYSVTLARFADVYLEEMNDGQPTTRRSRASHIRALKASPLAGMPMVEITSRDVRAYLTSLTDAGASPSTVNTRLGTIRTLFDAAIEERIVVGNPARARTVKAPPLKTSLPRDPMRWEDWDRAVKLLPEWARPAIVLATYMGLRISEVCGLRWENVSFTTGEIYVQDVIIGGNIERDFPKGKDSVWLDMPDPVIAVLTALRERRPADKGSDRVIRSPHPRSEFVRPGHLRSTWNKARKAARIPGDVDSRFHGLRHLFASDLAQRNAVTPWELMELMRHKNIATTTRYVATNRMSRRAAMNDRPITVAV